jgi:allophanate hydrolase subunit 2
MTPPVLCVIDEAGLATVQDGGRPSLAGLGVPRSGAWHRSRYRTAAALVGADHDQSAAVELLAGRLALTLRQATALAVVGPADVRVHGEELPTDTALHVSAGQHVTVVHGGAGPVYVTVAGWQEPRTLGSCSTDTFSGIGGRVIGHGDVLLGWGDSGQVGSFARPAAATTSPSASTLRVIASGDADWCTQEWAVAATARSGTRLAGPVREVSSALPSRPTIVGAVQLTPAGEAIILGPDGGLTGGYATCGVLITADLDLVSELAVGVSIRFVPVDVAEASRAFEAQGSAEGRLVVRAGRLGQEPAPG